jgi:hypothetical protein
LTVILTNLGENYKIKKPADIDISILEQLCKETIAYLNEHYECAACR